MYQMIWPKMFLLLFVYGVMGVAPPRYQQKQLPVLINESRTNDEQVVFDFDLTGSRFFQTRENIRQYRCTAKTPHNKQYTKHFETHIY